MNKENKNILIKLYKFKSNIYNKKIEKPNIISLKKQLPKSKTNFISIPSDISGLQDKSSENPKTLLENKKTNIPFILPSLPFTPISNKIRLNSSKNNIFNNNSFISPKKKYIVKLKKIKIKKPQPDDNRGTFRPFKKNKSLIDLYNENLRLKERLERYKIKKAENIGNFSYNKYNYNLMKYSSIDLSLDSVKTFKKNMKNIEDYMNGQIIKRKNRWELFLDKIGNFAPEGLKQKLKSLSERRCQRHDNTKGDSK